MSANDKYIEGIDLEHLPAGAREVLIALGQFQDDEPVDQFCPHCGQPISVDGIIPDGQSEPTVWLTRCPCGMCSGTFRGV